MPTPFFEASITIVLAVSLASYTLVFGQPGRARRVFVWLLASIVAWSGGVAAARTLDEPSDVNFWVRVSFLGIFSLPPAWFALGRHLTRRGGRDLSSTGLVLLTLPSIAFAATMLTNHHHHLYMRAPELIGSHGPLDWAGPAFWLWVAWSYVLVCGTSIRYVSWSWRLVHEDARWRAGLIALASILPLSGNAAHLLGWTAGDHDLTPLMLGAATAMLFLADWRFRMLDTLPVARRDVIDHIRDGVIVTDGRGVVLDLNPAAARMIGAPETELIGLPILDVIAAKSVDRFDYDPDVLAQTLMTMGRAATGFETTIVDHEGRHYEIRSSSVADRMGQVSGIYLIMREVTEQRRLEEVQRESRRAHSIASLAAGITHEVNNPLCYVRGNVSHVMSVLDEWRESLPTKAEEFDDLHSALEDAIEGVDRIGTIVERVRQFTRTRGGVRESLEVTALVEAALRVSAPASDPSIAIETDLQQGLPPVMGVRDGLLESVTSLLDNARHALQETGGTIRVSTRRVDHGVRIEVEDDGPGVTADLQEQIFEPFFSVGAHGFGAGLGLAIARKCIAELGGTLCHEPVERGGARFVIELPPRAES